MFELLKQKGYKGRNNHLQVISWLKNQGIYIEVSIVWSEGGVKPLGYYGKCWIPPFEKPYITNIVNTFKEAIEGVVISMIDYIPKVK